MEYNTKKFRIVKVHGRVRVFQKNVDSYKSRTEEITERFSSKNWKEIVDIVKARERTLEKYDKLHFAFPNEVYNFKKNEYITHKNDILLDEAMIDYNPIDQDNLYSFSIEIERERLIVWMLDSDGVYFYREQIHFNSIEEVLDLLKKTITKYSIRSLV